MIKGTSLQKYKAHSMVTIAIAKGRLKKQACTVCGEISGVHAHHPDYSKPLDVVWLCPRHHSKLHGAERRAINIRKKIGKREHLNISVSKEFKTHLEKCAKKEKRELAQYCRILLCQGSNCPF